MIAYNYLTKNKVAAQARRRVRLGRQAHHLVERKFSYAPDVLLTPANIGDFDF